MDEPEESKDESYLRKFVEREQSALESRKVISEILLRFSCQSLSFSLGILLFQVALSVWITALLCYVVSMAPLVKGVALIPEEEDTWRVVVMRDGVKLIVSFAIAVGFTHLRLTEVYTQISQTDIGINKFLTDMRAYERPTEYQYQFPSQWVVLLAAVGVTVVLGYLLEKGKR